MPGLRVCVWKDLDLNVDDTSLREIINSSSSGISDPWADIARKPGLTIWRITKYRATQWPEEEYGHFYDADAFIVLHTNFPDIESDVPHYNVHLWMGKYAQKDEYEAAMVKILELDWKLGYEAILHRETQSRESLSFRSYFDPITIWKGDSESRMRGLKGEAYPARLLRYYKPNARYNFMCMKEVPTQRQYLDSDCVFVMDLGYQVYQWNGSECTSDDKVKAIRYCQTLRSTRGMECPYEMIDELTSPDHYFYFYLKEGRESSLLVDSDDETASMVSTLKALKTELYQVFISKQNVQFKKIKSGSVVASDLKDQKMCLVDNGDHCFVWLSSQSMHEKRLALQYAHSFLKNTEHPLIPVTIVKQDQPSALFDRILNHTSSNAFSNGY